MRNGNGTAGLRLRVLVLGRLELVVDGRPHPLPDGQPGRALLAWLALNPGVHERNHIAEQLWPGGLRKARRDSLKTALTKIRRVLGSDVFDTCFAATREELGIRPGTVTTDLGELRSLMDDDRLDEALDLIRGELLSGITMEWVEDPRSRQHAVHVDLVSRLAADAGARRDDAKAIELARRHVELEALDERASLALISIYAAAGKRSLALEEAERLRRAHHRSGVRYEPSAAMRRTVARLSDGGRPSGSGRRRAAPVLRGYRWDGHLCGAGHGDPHRAFAVLHIRIAFATADVDAPLHVGCVAADEGWTSRPSGDGQPLVLAGRVDAALDPADARVFAVEEVLFDGEPAPATGVETLELRAGRAVAHAYRPPPASGASAFRNVDVLLRTRIYIGNDSRVPVTAVLPQAVTDAEFRLTVAQDIRARRISVATTRVIPGDPDGTAVCGKLVGPGGGVSGAIARFAFPLEHGSAVSFELEREPSPTLRPPQRPVGRTRPVGRSRRRI